MKAKRQQEEEDGRRNEEGKKAIQAGHKVETLAVDSAILSGSHLI